MAVKTFTIEAISEMIEVPAKTIRKILRANVPAEKQPGRGGRWVIAEKDLQTIKDMVNTYRAKTHSVADLSDLAETE